METNFNNEDIFNHFKNLDEVTVGGRKLNMVINEYYNSIAFFYNKKPFHVVHKNELYQRWVLIDGVLHYIQRVNHWMGKTKYNYVKAEV